MNADCKTAVVNRNLPTSEEIQALVDCNNDATQTASTKWILARNSLITDVEDAIDAAGY